MEEANKLRRVLNFIDGELAEPEAGRFSKLVNPATEEEFAEAALSDEGDARKACEAARAAFPAWSGATPAERGRAISEIADAIEEHGEEFVLLESENTGKPLEWVRGEELPTMVDQIRFFAGAARSLTGLSTGEYVKGHTSLLRREPVGVCAQVTPWNYPMMMAVWKWAPALAAGNTVVLKPSDTTPVTTVHMAGIMAEFLPKGVFNVVCGDRDTGRALVSQPIPRMVSVTGSARAGREVAASVASDLKRVHLELGGKAPVLVFADANLPVTVEGVSAAGYLNAGQDCTAATRVLVEEPIYELFLGLLVERARKTHFGAPDEPGVEYGPLNSLAHLERVQGFMSLTPSHAEVLTGGKRAPGRKGYYFEPTIIAGLRQDDELIQSEIFGPVITVQPFPDDETAIRLANDVEFGLGASVWTTSHQRALRFSRELDFGTVWINCHLINPAEMPNAGFKHSGDGTDLSLLGLENYTRLKHVMSALE